MTDANGDRKSITAHDKSEPTKAGSDKKSMAQTPGELESLLRGPSGAK